MSSPAACNPLRPGATSSTARARVGQFLKFGSVGGLGLVWDTVTLYATRPILGLAGATMAAYFVAATMNWLMHRHWTFRHVRHADGALTQWMRFLMANSCGFALNRGTVFTLFLTMPLCRAIPALALAAGLLAGMLANFNLSRRLVFRHHDAGAVPRHSGPDCPASQNAASSLTDVRNSDSSIG
ncbi:GtrA family protein [Gluconacetobacter azotocaptans]|uniref:GtrA family protein n=1 Tax=Gluconacetobacter azotocaptans TaxID=142834 RepID=A0A7W4JRN8_9PROT|nr:GtrA family protein [Gluconacetobacter azotocaptans]MBM9401387.1 GtrA family protein [Gluconacetobacter azotocaptans]